LKQLGKKITILDAIHLTKELWNKLSAKTIQNCFRRDGFKTNDKRDDRQKPFDLSDKVYNDWIDVDSHIDVAN